MATSDSRRYSIQTSFSFSDALPRDRVIVPEDVWRSLLFISEQEAISSAGKEIAVSLTFHKSTQHIPDCGLICRIAWAAAPQALLCPPLPGTIVVSQQLYRELSLDDGVPICSMAVVTPALLTEVTIFVSSNDSLHASVEELSGIEQLLCSDNRILRTGDTLYGRRAGQLLEDCYDSAYQSCYRLEIAMAKPVSQGYAVPGKTRFLVAIDDFEFDLASSSSAISVNNASRGTLSADDKFTIDENFFASSTLGNVGQIPLKSSSARTAYKGDSGSAAGFFSAEHLPRHSMQDFNESYAMSISTEDLGKLGIFSGDWCIAKFSNECSRLVQVNGIDVSCKPAYNGSCRGRVFASSQLLYNCGSKMHGRGTLSIQASPFGASPPSIPTARTATLARIASPLSLDKTHYSAMLRCLKKKLDVSRYLVKKGDIISVPVYTDNVVESEGFSEGMSTFADSGGVSSKSMFYEQSHSWSIFHFVVSSLDYDVVKSNDLDPELDTLARSAFGELGCWIDSSVTRVVQTGIEHLAVPGVQYESLATWSERGLDSFGARFNKIYDLASAAFEENAATLGLDLLVLLKGPTASVMIATVNMVANCLGFHLLEISAFDIVSESEAKTEARLREEFDMAMSCSPCVFILRDIDGLMQVTQTEMGKEHAITHIFQECTNVLRTNWQQTGFPVLVIATTSNAERLSASMLSCFKHEVIFEVPDETARLALLKPLVNENSLATDVSLKELAIQTAALTEDDLTDLISHMHLNATERTIENIPTKTYEDIRAIHNTGMVLTEDDSYTAIEKARTSFSQNIGAPSIPNVSWNDVGGLAKVKRDILDTIQLPLDNPSLFADGLKKRSGILLYGPPGTGKTLLAKAVATSCSLNFFSVKGPELLNMYIGESEANVRRVFQQAREAKPCVIFFDELDSIAPKRGNHGDSGGVMDRIVSQLLAELDGMSSSRAGADVFVIGATNRPDLLDAALLRPGRFDRLLYLGVSDTHEAQLDILRALTRKFRLDPRLELMSIAEQCPFNYTGADFYALCSDAMLKAMARKAQSVEEMLRRMNEEPRILSHQYPLTPQYYLSELATPSETDVVVSAIDFQESLQELVPSVSQSEMEHYGEIQRRFSQDIGKESSSI